MANGNPFYVQPGSEFGPGLAGLAQSVQNLGEIRAKKRAKEKFETVKAGALEAFRSNDPRKVSEYMLQFPEMAKVMDFAANWESEQTKKNLIQSSLAFLQAHEKGKREGVAPTSEFLPKESETTSLMSTYDPSGLTDKEIKDQSTLDEALKKEGIDPDIDFPTEKEEIMQQRKDVLDKAGVPPERRKETDSFGKNYKLDPEGTVKRVKMDLATYAPDLLIAYEKIYGSEEETKAIPTDIDDFVVDADAESVRLTGKKLTPGERNKARLQFKRAQVREVQANRLAERNVDAATASKIKYNEGIGKVLAEIETAASLIKAKGEVSPQAKIDKAKIRMGGNLATLANHYITLDSTGAMLNVDNTTSENVMAAIRSSTIGQQFGRITGTNEQSVRSSIRKLKPLIIQDIRQSTDMGARGLDSEKELEFYLQAATDEKTDIQSNIAAIVVLDEAFGNGQVASKLRNLTNKSIIKRISDEGKMILSGIPEEVSKLPPQQRKIVLRPAGAPADSPTITTQEQYDELKRKRGAGIWYYDPVTGQWEQTQ